MLSSLVLQHHERLNGSGYPNKLKDNEIRIEARILGVADTIESMASHRPYRPAIGIKGALKEIEAGRGIYYDEGVVDACLRVFKDDRFSF